MLFKAYINEGELKKSSLKNVVIIAPKAGNSDTTAGTTAEKMIKALQKMQYNVFVAFAEYARLSLDDDKNIFIYNENDDKNKLKITQDDTLILIRGGVTKYLSSSDFISQLEKLGFYTVNRKKSIELCADKYLTIVTLNHMDIPVPKTSVINSFSDIESAFKNLKTKFPIILKTLKGSQGIGVFQIDSMVSLKSVLQTIFKMSDNSEIILQEKMDIDGDYRIHVLGDRVFAAMMRHKINKDFRSNASLGAEVSGIEIDELDEDIKQLALDANKAVGGIWTGVDIMRDKKSGKLYVIEVNSSPGTDGIDEATGKNVTKEALKYLTNKNNWVYPKTECGYIESVFIPLLDKRLSAKFDTGNGSHCSINCTDYKIENKNVNWEYEGKKYTSKLVGTIKVNIGGLSSKIIDMPIISLDIKFNGKEYKNVSFCLADRTKKAGSVLLNRKFMKLARIIINSDEKYLVSVPPNEDNPS